MSEAELANMMKDADPDGSGEVDFEEVRLPNKPGPPLPVLTHDVLLKKRAAVPSLDLSTSPLAGSFAA